MENITYILGAGFSALAGLPIMSNFITKAKDIYYSDKSKFGHFKQIFDSMDEMSKIKNYFLSDLLNIEELFSIYDMESTLSQKRKSKTFSTFIIDVIKHYSYELKDIRHEHPANWEDFIFGIDETHRNISSFVASIFMLEFYQNPAVSREKSFMTKRMESKIHYSIVSLNYDSLLEIALQSINDNYNSNNVFEKNSYIPDWSIPMLYKLHGDVENGTIIPPTWSKSISTEMINTWKNAYELVRTSTQIRFLGYSLPASDTYFQYFLKAAIKNNPYLKNIDILCLDQNRQVEDRYRKIFNFRDFRFKNINLRQYCNDLWKREFLISNIPQNIRCDKLETVHDKVMQIQD